MPEIPPQTVTEEKYTDEYGNMVVKKVNTLTFIFSVSLHGFRDFTQQLLQLVMKKPYSIILLSD